MFLSESNHRARKHLYLGVPPGYPVLSHRWNALRIQRLKQPYIIIPVRPGKRDAFRISKRDHLFHGCDHRIMCLAFPKNARIVGSISHASLVYAYIQHELAPDAVHDVRILLIRHLDLVEVL